MQPSSHGPTKGVRSTSCGGSLLSPGLAGLTISGAHRSLTASHSTGQMRTPFSETPIILRYTASQAKGASVRLSSLTVILCILISKFALANGCYFPEVAYPVLPSIPSQQAVIIPKDGQKTLIVESPERHCASSTCITGARSVQEFC